MPIFHVMASLSLVHLANSIGGVIGAAAGEIGAMPEPASSSVALAVSQPALAPAALQDAGSAPQPDAASQPDTGPEPAAGTLADDTGAVDAGDDTAFADADADAPGVFADISDDAVVEKVLGYLDEVQTLSGAFDQLSPSGAQSSGKFWLRRPGQIRFDYDPPSPLRVIATQGNVYVEDADLEQTDFYPIKKTPLRFLLAKKVELDGIDVVAVDRGVSSVSVTFAAADEETEGDLSVILDAPSLALREWIVRDPQNGITIVTLRDVKSGERLSNRLFRAPEAGGAFINN